MIQGTYKEMALRLGAAGFVVTRADARGRRVKYRHDASSAVVFLPRVDPDRGCPRNTCRKVQVALTLAGARDSVAPRRRRPPEPEPPGEPPGEPPVEGALPAVSPPEPGPPGEGANGDPVPAADALSTRSAWLSSTESNPTRRCSTPAHKVAYRLTAWARGQGS